jgi:hypothetical protein
MSTRLFTKVSWQYDSDCRLERLPGGPGLVIAPPLPPLPSYHCYRAGAGHGHYRANPGSFRKSYLGKAVRWMKQGRRRMSRKGTL